MADAKGGEKEAGSDEEGAAPVQGVSPPTLKFPAPDAGVQQTQIGNFPSLGGIPASASKGKSSRGSMPTLSGDMSHETFVSDVPFQDLSSERLLRDAERIESHGKLCPALNGIPILAKLGQGGMGAVYYGIHPRLRAEVAIKVLPFHLVEQDPGMIQRFFREAQIAAQVRSPHLVNVMDVNEESGLFFLVMEYVSGYSAGQLLRKFIQEGKPGLSELDALEVCIAATEGLHAAHSQGIVHRDLKPENIMVPYLSRTDKTFDLMHSKLMDLGLARSEASSQSLTGGQAAMGTPGYMAPEQALDAKKADKRSDVFGMGATLYGLLSGKAPFHGEAVMKIIMDTINVQHLPIEKVRPGISASVSEVLEKSLHKKQENRYQDAQQLLRALKNCHKPLTISVDDNARGGGSAPAVVSTSVAAPGGSPVLAKSPTRLKLHPGGCCGEEVGRRARGHYCKNPGDH